MKHASFVAGLFVATHWANPAASQSAAAGTLPPSVLSSMEARRVAEHGYPTAARWKRDAPADLSTREGVLVARRVADELRAEQVQQLLTRYPVSIRPEEMGGVQTDVVEPKSGVAPRNRHRVLINLHGGGFVFGARYEGQIASIPIASLGQVRVVTVDYRMGPEHRFPAASEDVAKVYQALLRDYDPRHIGIYGCSSGALLTAQSVAWFNAHGLPQPGAVALEGGGALADVHGDSYYFSQLAAGQTPKPPPGKFALPYLLHYFGEDDLRKPLASPALHPDVLERFPPTLVLTASRDIFLSGAVVTHRELSKAGVSAELLVWEGVGHCFSYDSDLPESREAHQLLIRFFEKHAVQPDRK
jgi:epsilon-lactone hydrolase